MSGIFGLTLAIAVPSRLYFEKSASKTLDGMSIAVNDNFDLKGIHTAVSSNVVSQVPRPGCRDGPGAEGAGGERCHTGR